jgi:hypothetical protein
VVVCRSCLTGRCCARSCRSRYCLGHTIVLFLPVFGPAVFLTCCTPCSAFLCHVTWLAASVAHCCWIRFFSFVVTSFCLFVDRAPVDRAPLDASRVTVPLHYVLYLRGINKSLLLQCPH